MAMRFAILLLLGLSWGSLQDEYLVVEFFQAKFCTSGVIISCSSTTDQLRLWKNLTRFGLKVSINDIARLTPALLDNLPQRFNRLALVIDVDCENSEAILQQCADSKLFHPSYHWLAVGSHHNSSEKFRSVALTIGADLSFIPREGSSTNWTIFDVYNQAYHHGGELKMEAVGYYSGGGYRVLTRSAKYFRRRNMTGTVFNTAMVIPENISMSLEQYMAKEDERNNNTFTRFQSITVRNCADYYNFSMNMTLMQSWGYQQPNGEVDGMVGALKAKQLDFGLAPLMFKEYRLRLIDYGYGNWIIKSVFIFRHPKSTATSYELYVRPLEGPVWITTFATVALMVIILKVVGTKEIAILGFEAEGGQNSWSFLFLYGVGEICQQGFAYIPILPSGRIVIFFVLIFSFIIYQFYSASLVSFLLLDPKQTILTLLDLLQSPLKAGVEDSLFDRDYLAKTPDPVAIELYNTKIKGAGNRSNFLLPEEGLQKVQEGGFAFHTQTSTAYPIIERYFKEKAICELAEVQMYPTQFMYTSIQKHSPFKGMLDYCMAHQREVGVIDRLRKYWEAPRPGCLDSINHKEITIGLEESYWALLLLGLGILFSLVLLALERIWADKQKLINDLFKKKEKSIKPFTN